MKSKKNNKKIIIYMEKKLFKTKNKKTFKTKDKINKEERRTTINEYKCWTLGLPLIITIF